MHERVLAIDYGKKRIGLAASDPLGLTAQPLPFLPNLGRKKLLEDLKKIVQEKSIRTVVMGLPISLDGTIGERANEYKNVAEDIRRELGVEMVLVDERFTTKNAEEFLINDLDLSREKRKKVKDSMAACLMLRSYLDSL